MVGRCPFHSEKTPSFTVFEDNFHCFGCGAGGDALTFLLKTQNKDFKELIAELAEKAGISVATVTKLSKDGAVVSSDVLVKICAALDCTVDDIMEIVPNENA